MSMEKEIMLFNEAVEFEKGMNTSNTVFIFTVKNKMNLMKTGIFNGNEKYFIITRFNVPESTCHTPAHVWSWYRVICEDGSVALDYKPRDLNLNRAQEKQIEFLKEVIKNVE